MRYESLGVKSMTVASSNDPAVLGVILFVGGIIGFFWGLRQYLRRRLIAQTPTSKVQSAALGAVELAGKTACDAPLTSPICRTACAYFCYKVEEERKDSKGRTHWSTVLEGKSEETFFLEDPTGRMLIDPRKAEVDIPQDYQETFGGMFSDIPVAIQEFVTSQGGRTHGWLGGEKRMRFTEWRLEPGDPLFVLGTLVERTDLRERSPVPHENLVVRGEGRYYLISDTSEKDELSRLFWRALGGIAGGGAGAVAGFWIVLHRLGIL